MGCVVLLMIVLIMFAIFIVQGVTYDLQDLANDPVAHSLRVQSLDGSFNSLPIAMRTLYQSTTGGVDWDNPFQIIAQAGALYKLAFLFYITFFVIVAWNIVSSTFIEKTLKLAVPDIDTMLMERRRQDVSYT